MIVGCYVLHVYCDNAEHPPLVERKAEFTGPNERKTLFEARKAGWGISPIRKWATCPNCLKREG